MTRFLTAVKLTTAPWLELWESKGPSIPPIQQTFSPELLGAPKSVKFSQDQTLMAMVSEYQRSTIQGLGNPSFANTDGIRVYSPSDDYMLFGGSATKQAAMLARVGQFYVPCPGFPVPALGVYIVSAKMAVSGNVITVVTSDATSTLKVYKKTSGAGSSAVWTLAASFTGVGTGVSPEISPDGEYIFNVGGAVDAKTIYRLVAGTYTPFGPVIGGTTVSLKAWTKRANGDYEFVLEDSSGNLRPYKLSAGVATARAILTNPVSSNKTSYGVVYSRDGDVLAVNWTNVAVGCIFRIYAITAPATDYAQVLTYTNNGQITGGSTTPPAVIRSKDGTYIAVSFGRPASGATNQIRVYQIPTAAPYNPTLLFATALFGGILYPVNFSPDNSILHAVSGTLGRHISMSSPYADITAQGGLPFAPGVFPVNITSVSYGEKGEVVIATNSSPAQVLSSIKDGGGNYLSYSTLEGVFVTLYDRTGTNFAERTFAQHVLGSVVSDIQISKLNQSLMYHVEKAGASSGKGRYVYDIRAKKFLRTGVVFVTGDDKSLAAISPHEDYFVVVYHNDTLPSSVKLYKFNGDITYVEKDSHSVAYGPPAFSACDTVLVAHGGVQPYSLYQHNRTTDKLEEQVVAVTNWDADSEILLAAFTPDCAGAILATDDSIDLIVGDDKVAEEPAPGNSDPDISPDPDNPDYVQVTDRGPGSGGGGGGKGWSGGWTVNPDKTIDNINYLPYVCVSVTYRTW